MTGRLTGKVAIVTGAGSQSEELGIGRAIAIEFAREGASVFAVDMDTKAVTDTRNRIISENGICEIWIADVSDNAAVQSMVENCVARFGKVDILVNNVGIVKIGGPVDLSEEDWDRTFAVNIKSMFLTCKHVLPLMERNGGGSIVNISSVASICWSGVAYPAYSASKAAVNSFTKYVALEYARKNIRANYILPGLINTPMVVEPLTRHYGDITKMIEARNAMSPTGAMGDGWDIAKAAVYLASDDSSYVSGAPLLVDAGLTFQVPMPG